MEDNYEKFQPLTPKVEPTKNPVYKLVQSTSSALMSDTPKWAKVVRIGSIILAAAGLALGAPAAAGSVFAFLVPYAGTMETVGIFLTGIVQFTSKKD